MPKIVEDESLLRLIEIELVSQYQRFLKKNLAVSPKSCRFNVWTATPEGGFIRMCRCPKINNVSVNLQVMVDQVVDQPCTTLHHAKRCPLYQHFTGVPTHKVVEALTGDFLLRLADPLKRAASFKVIHTLWLLLHENESVSLSWSTRMVLKIVGKIFNRKYHAYLIKLTPKADATWGTLTENFKVALHKQQ